MLSGPRVGAGAVQTVSCGSGTEQTVPARKGEKKFMTPMEQWKKGLWWEGEKRAWDWVGWVSGKWD